LTLDQSQTPILTALAQRVRQPYAGFHTPGHQQGRGGAGMLLSLWGAQTLAYDLAEIPGLDNLAAPETVIDQAQQLAAQAFAATQTWFLVNGSTVGVMAAILATCGEGEVILLPRNAHQSVIAGAVLAGVEPVFITPDLDPETGLVYPLTPERVVLALAQYPQARAVLVVSPTYEGLCGHISEIAAVVHAHDLPLIVDEAHGAHLHFHPQLPTAALDAGADLVVQSTHKVLAACTQAAMLHLKGARVAPERVSRALRLLQSSSPSYVLLASLDAARQQMANHGQTIYTDLLTKAAWIRQTLSQMPGLEVITPDHIDPKKATLDPTRLTLDLRGWGLSGYQVDDYLDQHSQITAELPALQTLTFILSLGVSQADLVALVTALQQLAQHPPVATTSPLNPQPCVAIPQITTLACSPRQAFLAKPQMLPWAAAVGEISADWICPYPPGIPILLPGETISRETLDQLHRATQAGARLVGCSDPSLETLAVVITTGARPGN
jgi:arginine decarboxylase